jgi:NADH:ubiquinone oxidoreductase subunit 4 (subunit M)
VVHFFALLLWAASVLAYVGGMPLRTALLAAADAAGVAATAKVAGPSNIGNYLAGLGIPTTAGFGIDYRGLHGTDERIALESIAETAIVFSPSLEVVTPNSTHRARADRRIRLVIGGTLVPA